MATQAICSVSDCGKVASQRGWCWLHYMRWRRNGDPLIKSKLPKRAAPARPMLLCSIEGCTKRRRGHGLCSAHYTRQYRHGDPLGGGPEHGHAMKWLKEHVNYAGDECLFWPFAVGHGGDGVVSFRGKQTSTNFAMCCLAHGDPPTQKHEAAHSCGKGHEACINPMHLRWATRKENLADRLIHGTMLRGEQSPRAKLTIAQVREIRRLRGAIGQKEIAAMFGVSAAVVHFIQVRKKWAWLP